MQLEGQARDRDWRSQGHRRAAVRVIREGGGACDIDGHLGGGCGGRWQWKPTPAAGQPPLVSLRYNDQGVCSTLHSPQQRLAWRSGTLLCTLPESFLEHSGRWTSRRRLGPSH